MNKVFLDTNVVLYAYDLTSPAKRSRSLKILVASDQDAHSPVISTQVLQEFYNGLTRKLKIAPADAAVELNNLLSLKIAILTPTVIVAAITLHATASVSFWDALIIAAAQAADCDELWTEDLQDGQTFGKLKVVNPFVAL